MTEGHSSTIPSDNHQDITIPRESFYQRLHSSLIEGLMSRASFIVIPNQNLIDRQYVAGNLNLSSLPARERHLNSTDNMGIYSEVFFVLDDDAPDKNLQVAMWNKSNETKLWQFKTTEKWEMALDIPEVYTASANWPEDSKPFTPLTETYNLAVKKNDKWIGTSGSANSMTFQYLLLYSADEEAGKCPGTLSLLGGKGETYPATLCLKLRTNTLIESEHYKTLRSMEKSSRALRDVKGKGKALD